MGSLSQPSPAARHDGSFSFQNAATEDLDMTFHVSPNRIPCACMALLDQVNRQNKFYVLAHALVST